MDAIDGKILAELSHQGRMSITELGERVGLSVSPCHRRVRDLERDGIITGYRATIDHALTGFGFEAIVLVTMLRANSASVADFEEAVIKIGNIVEAQRLFGEPDYLLRVMCADTADYQRLWDEHLGTLPGVGKLNTTLVMKHVVADRPPTGLVRSTP